MIHALTVLPCMTADEVGGHPKSFERIKYHEKLTEFLHSKCTAHRDISREEKVGSDDSLLR